MPCLREADREVGEVLGRRDVVGVEALIDEQDAHGNVREIWISSGPEVNLRPVEYQAAKGMG
jgi:hypothetical protein